MQRLCCRCILWRWVPLNASAFDQFIAMNGLCQARLWCRLCWLWLGWKVGRDVGEACRLGGARLYYVFIIQITKSENWPGMSSFHPEIVMTSKFSNTQRLKLAQIYLTCSRVPLIPHHRVLPAFPPQYAFWNVPQIHLQLPWGSLRRESHNLQQPVSILLNFSQLQFHYL